ncbi:MAG: DUF1622 domain-containing protein [Oscillospiraceae bacterium]|jgi:uncharacterized membrane protein|nr:DUF1622 domain-containing protein [Oscillospiraceae bacterium]
MFAEIELVFQAIVEAGIMLLEFVGVAVLVVTAVRCVLSLVRHGDLIRLRLAEGIALALEFKLGAEVLRTVIVREWDEMLILGAVIALRGALTFLIHWEIKNEESRLTVPGEHTKNAGSEKR